MRTAELTRDTSETKIRLALNLDGTGQSEIDTGCGFLNHMLTLFARHGDFDLHLICCGDIDVDYHHSVEDIGIALGQAFTAALGDKRGITRYGQFLLPMARQRPTILGHIDLITKLNGGGELFDEDDRRYRAAAREALHAADPDATLLEINTGAMARGYRSVPYPARFLLEEWRAMGGRIILTADAHSPGAVVFGYREAAELARAAGYRESVLLTPGGQLPCPL